MRPIRPGFNAARLNVGHALPGSPHTTERVPGSGSVKLTHYRVPSALDVDGMQDYSVPR